MIGRRWRSTKQLLKRTMITAFLFSIFLYIAFNRRQHTDYLRDPNIKCKFTKEEKRKTLQVAYEVHQILDELHLDHWLMYGSILGALRYQEPLPWDYDVDYGIRGEQFTPEIKTRFYNMLTEKGIRIIDGLWKASAVYCRRSSAMVDVVLFTEYSDGMMKRRGWVPWLLFLNYRYFHSYPAKLVKSPLPTSKFGFFNVPVPRDGNEITKYLYRDDWWKEVKPVGCDKNKSDGSQ